MTHTNEDLLTLAERLDGIEIYSVREHLVGFGTRPIEAANNAVCEAAAALRAIVAERQAVRDRALDDAAQCCADEADRCDDAVKWGGHRRYIQDCKAAAYAMRDRAYAIRAMKGKPE